jgi:hypothetical protein
MKGKESDHRIYWKEHIQENLQCGTYHMIVMPEGETVRDEYIDIMMAV